MSKKIYQRTIPTLILSIIIGILTIEYLYSNPTLVAVKGELQDWGVILTNMTGLFGVAAITILQARRIRSMKRDLRTFRSICFWITFLLFIVVALIYPGLASSTEWKWLYDAIVTSTRPASLGMGFLFEAWAVYQAFRIRSVDSGVYAIIAIVAMLGLTPMGPYLLPFLGPTKDWIQAYIGNGGGVANTIVAGIASVYLITHAMLGKEPSLIGVEIEE